ncbi:DNA (cytosine-5-)-methyltransferase [Patescibacteria group bacterium]|nr:DNA (cytosine-5-)-methyltransferase [Patescibacteria group bacterium]
MKKFTTIDLFAGVGGIRLGFEKAEFDTVYANDYDKNCKITYDANFDKVPLTIKDITKQSDANFSSVLDDIKKIKYDVLLGGFPCQAFSIAGYRQGFRDSRGIGDLFFYVAEIIEKTQPKAFLLENVKNLKGHDKGRTYKIIKETLESLGYHVKEEILNSMDYGNLPQNRERMYIVGFKSKEQFDRFKFPKKIKRSKKISDILEEKVDPYFYYENKSIWEKIKDYPFVENIVYQWRRVYVRENKSGVCPTLTANMGTGGHNVPLVKDKKGVRKLTPLECFRIQGFPEEYALPDIAKSHLYKQAGNSVSVPVIYRIATNMLEALQS